MPLETVFVYGSLKRGFINHHVMAGTEFLGAGVTQPGFAMLGLGRYPGVVRGTAVIAGEVFAVPAPRMGRLDRLEDNGRVYRREVIPIRLPSGVVDAWIYLYLLARGHKKPVKPRGNVVTWRENPGREIPGAKILPCRNSAGRGLMHPAGCSPCSRLRSPAPACCCGPS